jgi:hypothetical protein
MPCLKASKASLSCPKQLPPAACTGSSCRASAMGKKLLQVAAAADCGKEPGEHRRRVMHGAHGGGGDHKSFQCYKCAIKRPGNVRGSVLLLVKYVWTWFKTFLPWLMLGRQRASHHSPVVASPVKIEVTRPFLHGLTCGET